MTQDLTLTSQVPPTVALPTIATLEMDVDVPPTVELPSIASLHISGDNFPQDPEGMLDIRTASDEAADAETERSMQVLSVSVGPPAARLMVGQFAVRSLMMEAVSQQRAHALKDFKHGLPVTAQSKPLTQRFAEEASGSTTAFEFHYPSRAVDEFRDIGIAFGVSRAAAAAAAAAALCAGCCSPPSPQRGESQKRATRGTQPPAATTFPLPDFPLPESVESRESRAIESESESRELA